MPGGSGVLHNHLLGHRVRLILALTLFVLYHAALQVQHFLVDGFVA